MDRDELTPESMAFFRNYKIVVPVFVAVTGN
jgi:hypothetical protein